MIDEKKIARLQQEIIDLKKQLDEANTCLKPQGTCNAVAETVDQNDRQENSIRFNSIIDDLLGVVYRCNNDRDWTMEFISNGIEHLTGYPPSDFIDNRIRSFDSIVHPDDRVQLWERWQDALSKRTFFANEYRIVDSKGHVHWVWERGCGVFEDDKLIALEGFISDITEAKDLAEDLNVKDELLHSIGEIAKVGGWEFDVLTMEGSLTDEVALIHDLDPNEEINANEGLNYYVKEHRPIIEKAIKEAIEDGIPYDLELQIISAKGVRKWVRTNGIPIYENDRVVKIKGTFQDITIRKEALISLENEKLRLKTLIETIPDLIWLKDPEGVYITCNPRFERFFGAPESKIKGKTDYDFMDTEQADFFRQKDKEALIANKPKINLEWVTYADDGHKEFLETIKTPMYSAQGELIGVLGIARDITEIFQNEQKLKEKDLIFQSLLENSPVYIFFKDHDIKALYLSRNFEEMIGLPMDQILGKDMNEIFPSELAKSMIEDDKRILKDGRLVVVNEELAGRYYTTIKFPIHKDEGKPMLAGFTIDVTETEIAKQELVVAKEKAEESDKLKTAFLQNMSHEIRTPMNAIMGFSELLTDVFDDKNKLELYTEIISNRCHDLLRLINGMLDIARIESGHVNIFLEKCNLTNWISELMLDFVEYRKGIEKQHIDLEYKLECDKQESVVFDQGKVKQILINLVSNALKFTDKGIIEVGCKIIEENQIQFYVSDTGLGIDKENQGKIFERFAQIDPDMSSVYKGAGLGLSIVKGLLESMGGEIWLASEAGAGSKFTFTVPFVRE